MRTHLQLLDQLHGLVPLARPPAPTDKVTATIGSLGAPPEYRPGQTCTDPETGETCEVIAYGRTHQVVEAARPEGA